MRSLTQLISALLAKPRLLAFFPVAVLLTLLLSVGFWYRPVENFTDPNEPLFTGNFAETPGRFAGRLKVITWNIKYAEKIETAIAELSTVEALQSADIILLQEMDETGAEAIAQALKTNYVYYPASIHPHHRRNFGNAILSRWPLSHPAKLLPYESRIGQRRIAVRAVVTVEQTELLVYSIHTETIWLAEGKRLAQIETVVTDIGWQARAYVIAGGDFNSATPHSVTAVEDLFAQVGLERVSLGSGPSVVVSWIPFIADHIFARGLSGLAAGVWPDTQASDHRPLWVEVALPGNKNLQ